MDLSGIRKFRDGIFRVLAGLGQVLLLAVAVIWFWSPVISFFDLELLLLSSIPLMLVGMGAGAFYFAWENQPPWWLWKYRKAISLIFLVGVLGRHMVGWYDSDEFVRRNFLAHRAEAEELVRMIREDAPIRSFTAYRMGQFVDPSIASKIPDERKKKYLALTVASGVNWIESREDGSVAMLVRMHGSALGHNDRGYLWSLKRPADLHTERDYAVYTALGGPWYLLHEED